MGEVKCKREEEEIFTVVRDVFVLKGRKHCVKEERRKKATIPDSPLRLILIRGWLGVFGCVWVMILNLRQELQDGGGEQRPDGQSDEIDEWSAHEPRPHQGHHKNPSQSEQTNQSHTQNWVTPHCRTHTHTHDITPQQTHPTAFTLLCYHLTQSDWNPWKYKTSVINTHVCSFRECHYVGVNWSRCFSPDATTQ